MIRRAELTQTLSATSLLASLLAALALVWIQASKELNQASVLSELILAVVGLSTGVAGLIAWRGLGRVPLMAILGCVLGLPVISIVFILSLFAFGGD